jgi:alginate O-acetyltransferase complex protein AlgI
VSIIFNYAIGYTLSSFHNLNRKSILVAGICFNLMLLSYFKYCDFFISNVNFLIGDNIKLLNIALPVGISFFTFTQIAFIVDAYKEKTRQYNLIDYALFVSFFPYIFAGPIVHHKEIIPQYNKKRNKILNYHILSKGVFLFFIGLFKKVIIADRFGELANAGFDTTETLTLFEAWAASISYTMQIYFDFSGYTDMALGSAFMFNIKLPINFNSPYKSLNIQEFWRRWHITLSRFMRNYVYIPLGGNIKGDARLFFNLLVTFLIVGLWHGAAWTFIFWGFLHGIGVIIFRLWQRLNIPMPKVLAWIITFNFINIAWIFFRAKSWGSALNVLKGMLGLSGIMLPLRFSEKFQLLREYGIDFGPWLMGKQSIFMILVFLFFTAFLKNSNEIIESFRTTKVYVVAISFIIVLSVLHLSGHSEFLYFKF